MKQRNSNTLRNKIPASKMITRVFDSDSPEETSSLGSNFAGLTKPGSVVCLTGQLGAGKTTFVQGMARGLNITGKIKSPTFIIIREYPEKNFYHFDLYRINMKQFANLNLSQYFTEKNICVLEWAEKIKSLWRKDFIKVKISFKDKNKRIIRITGAK